MYRVLEMFDDLMDTIPTKAGQLPYRYEAGDLYPRDGYRPTMGRITELASDQNLRGRPVIAPIQAAVASVTIETEQTAPTEEKPKRKARSRKKEE